MASNYLLIYTRNIVNDPALFDQGIGPGRPGRNLVFLPLRYGGRSRQINI
jgi:hypothetical protein